MAFINKEALLTSTLATIYTVPAGKEAVIHAIYFTPLVATTDVTLKAGVSGSTGHVGKEVPLVEGGTLFYPKPVNLAAAEILEAKCLVSSDVEIFISILEKDV